MSHNTALTYLTCDSNNLTSLDMSHDTALTYLTCYFNHAAITANGGTFDLSTLPGFDVAKASDWNGGTVSGTTLTVPESGDVTYTYDCGQGFSETFTLNVMVIAAVKPTITGQPQSVTVTAGKTATFTVTAEDADSYQWYYRKPGETTWNKCTKNATSASYSVSTEARHNGYSYRCKVKNGIGTTTSKTATLTVLTKPSITAQPASVTVIKGQTATFTVVATGTGLTYQWYYQKPGETTWNACSNNATSATYSVVTAARHNGYSYRCKVTNSGDGYVYTSAATLTVN